MWDCEFAGVCAVWYPQTNTVAFISAPLSGPAFTRADLQDTDSPQMEKPAAAGTGSPEAAVVRSSLHSRTGTTVRDWSATTELKDTDTPFRCKLCVRKKTSFGGLRAITWSAVMENKHKPFVFHLRETIFALRHTPTQKHARRWHTSRGQLQWAWNRGQCLWPFGLPHHGNTSSCADIAAGPDLHTHTHKITQFKAT